MLQLATSYLLDERAKFVPYVIAWLVVCFERKGWLHFVVEMAKINANMSRARGIHEAEYEAKDRCWAEGPFADDLG